MARDSRPADGGLAPEPPWHALTAAQVMARLETGPQGISSDEAAQRLRRFGPNRLKAAPPVSTLKLVVEEFRSPLVLVVLLASLLGQLPVTAVQIL